MDEASDYELLILIRSQDSESLDKLLKRYKLIIWKIVHTVCQFKPIGFDKDDLFQEGMLGLLDAIDAYRDDKNCSFATFASLCIERQIRSFLRKTRSHSYRLLSDAKSLDATLMVNEEDLALNELITIDIKEFNPEYMSMVAWVSDQVPILQKGVSDWQWKLYHMHQLGYSYKELSLEFAISEKQVDNTLQKIKHKINGLFDTI